ncbi:MAG: TonB family protein [Terriglobales bacterium]
MNRMLLASVVPIVGDQYVGFRESCLVVYADGRYHREKRSQLNVDGHVNGEWDSPAVFEGVVPAADLQELKEKITSDNFRAVAGTFGDPATLRMSLEFFASGGAVPRGDVEVFEAFIGRPTGPQTFEVFGRTNRRQLDESLRWFAAWVGEVEKRKQGRLDKAVPNGCSLSSSTTLAVPWEPLTRLTPIPLYTPSPAYQSEERNSGELEILVHAMVNPDGTVGHLSVKHGASPSLDQSALDAVKKWKFAPARIDGVAIPAAVNVGVQFHHD